MSIEGVLARSLAALGQLSVADHPLPEMLHRITVIANDAVSVSEMVGMTLIVDGGATTAAYTDEYAPELDSVQYETGIGPCLDAARLGDVFEIPSTKSDEKWKPFSIACHSRGFLSTLSAPVTAKSEKRAALNFYARQEQAFDADDIEVASAFAAQAAVAIENAEAYWSVRQLADQLLEGLESRTVIGQAKGLLMAGGHTGDEAFDMLKRASQRQNRKLRDIAGDIVSKAERRVQDS